MTRRERRLLLQTAALGVALSLLVMAADLLRMLEPLEQWLYDRRARYCQFFTPPPTDRLVHLLIDDAAHETVGRWPWDRHKLALIIDEVRIAGAKALALDLIFSEPQDEPAPVDFQLDSPVSHDDVLAESMRRFGRVLVPMAFDRPRSRSARYEQMIAAFESDLELTSIQMLEHVPGLELIDGRLGAQDVKRFIRARAAVMYARIDRALASNAALDFDALRSRLLPKTDRNVVPVQTRVLERQYDRVRSSRALRKLVRPAFSGDVDLLSLDDALLPMARFSEAAGSTGFVYYDADRDGAVRSLPLWVEHHSALYPQLGFALALAYLDIDIAQVRIGAEQVVLPGRSEQGDAQMIPVRRRRFEQVGRSFDVVMDVPFFGATDGWMTMYDPQRRSSVQFKTIDMIWQIIETRRRIADNNVAADEAIRFLYDISDSDKRVAYEKNPLPLDDPLARQKDIQFLLNDSFVVDNIKAAQQQLDAGAELDDRGQRFVASYRALSALVVQMPQLAVDLVEQRRQADEQLRDRAVLIGWTATGAAADFVPTPLHAKCPGVVVHGVVFNAILTGQTWSRAPAWVTPAATILIGLLSVMCLALLTPARAAIGSMLLLLSFAALNAVVLFDWQNTIMGFAGPLTVVVLVWGGCTLFRFIVERAERTRITRRFRNYVDPVLVNYVIEHPEQSRFDGEVRELTVVFTDLAGFTALSEKLQERTVAMLNEYTSLMVPIIRAQNGYLNKFLGDGMMFFYGAPRQNQYHALDAILTALKMQQAMAPFNVSLRARGLPELAMRIGISTGLMVVGDAGSDDASDYTVLGDIVNFGSRLEGANKYTDTWTMIDQRTAELVGDQFLLRPIARLQVVGKSQGVMTYEPLCIKEDATDEQRRLVDAAWAVVNAFIASDFDACLEAVSNFEAEFGQTKLTVLYRNRATQYAEHAPAPDAGFNGQIVLEEK